MLGWVQARRGGREEEEVASTISMDSGSACDDACRADLCWRKCFVRVYKSIEKKKTVPWAVASRGSLLERCDEQEDPCTLSW